MVQPGRSYNSPDYRYGFNTQEKVDEVKGSGNHYTAEFWLYNPRAVHRWNMDPKAHPGFSPYDIMRGNPIMFNDPYGDTVNIEHRTGFLGLGKKQTLKYEGGVLFNQDGSEYEGKVNGFLERALGALNEIRDTEEGSEMLHELEGSENIFTIKSGYKSKFVSDNKRKAYANQFATDPKYASAYESALEKGVDLSGGTGGTIYWNSRGGTMVPEVGGGYANRPTVFLGHEMFHGLDANRGLLDDRPHLGVKRSEWQAVYRENILRIQMGLPLRTNYKSEDIGARLRRPLPPLMLSPEGSPIRPSWY